jgi:hypothetical protein
VASEQDLDEIERLLERLLDEITTGNIECSPGQELHLRGALEAISLIRGRPDE